MKCLSLILLVGTALAAAAGNLTLLIDTTAPERSAFPHDAPCVGYAADPQVGDEAAALACRRAGAWLFRTSLCDDATLQFCGQYGLRLFLVLDGDRKTVVETLNRLAKSPRKSVIAGLQLGADPTGGSDPTMWRQLAALASRQFPHVPIALPVKDLDSPLFAKMEGYLSTVTHLVVDLRDAPAPYERIERIVEKLRRSPDKSVAKLRLWAVGSGRLAGMTDEKASAPAALAWQMHWIMSALAVYRMDGVFVERPYRADDFGLAMRHFWAVTTGNRSLVGHGEGATSAGVVRKKTMAPTVGLALDDGDGAGTLELNDAATPGPAPVACANIVAGKPGDVEYLVLLAPPVENDGQRVCLVLVNTTGERVKISVDVNKRGGDVSSGWRRRLVPDETKGAMRDSTRERTSQPLAEEIEPGEVTFLDFRI
jgi:hypothetical protein